jgi:uncharacterized protein (TIGR03067 family)
MAMLAFGWIPVALALLISSGSEEATKKECARFEGVWSFSQVEVDGVKQPAMAFPANKMIVLKDGRYVVVQGSRIIHGTVKLDPSTSPKHIDVTVTDGPAKGRTTMAIYDLSADTYKFCGSLRGKDRPAALASAAGSGTILHIMKREKETPRDALVKLYRQELAATWQATSFEREGTKATDDQLKDIQVIIDADGNTKSLIGGKVFLAGPCTVDPTQDPMTLDVTYTEGVNKGKTSLGIFKMDDGVLTICRRPPDKPRPTEFMSKPDSGTILISYKREKTETAK